MYAEPPDDGSSPECFDPDINSDPDPEAEAGNIAIVYINVLCLRSRGDELLYLAGMLPYFRSGFHHSPLLIFRRSSWGGGDPNFR